MAIDLTSFIEFTKTFIAGIDDGFVLDNEKFDVDENTLYLSLHIKKIDDNLAICVYLTIRIYPNKKMFLPVYVEVFDTRDIEDNKYHPFYSECKLFEIENDYIDIAKIKEGIIFLYDKVMNGYKPYYEKYLTYRNELKG